jgi:hypothetical protein
MRPPGGVDRGQAIQIGAVLLFGFLVVAFAGYQASILPQQNADVEFNHNQEVQQDMIELRNGILGTASTGTGRPVTVALGSEYPARSVGINPPPASGAVRTIPVGTRNRFTVNNTEGQDGETVDYWDGTTNRTFETRAIRYRPSYNELDNAPNTVYEHSVLYNRGPRNGGVSTKTDQALVDGKTVSLVALRGELDRTGSGAVSVDPSPDTAPPRTVSVTDGSGPVQVTLESNLPNSTWQELLASELDPDTTAGDASDGDDRYLAVASCATPDPDPCGTLTLTFETGVTYELRIAGVSVGGGAVSTTPAYAVSVEGDDTSIAEGGSQRLVAEVRDGYNNPVSGVSLNGSIEDSAGGGDTLEPPNATTDEDGRAVFVYEAPNNVNGNEVADVAVSFGTGTAATTATFNVTVMNSDGSGPGNNNNNNDVVSGSVAATDITADFSMGNDPGKKNQTISFELGDDLSDGESITIDLSDTDRSGPNAITYSDITSDAPGTVSKSGKLVTYTASGTESSGDTITIDAKADPGQSADGKEYTVVISSDTDGSSDSTTFSVVDG